MATPEKTTRRGWLKSMFAAVAGFVVGIGGGYFYAKSQEKRGIDVPDTEENMKLCICPTCPTFKGSPLTGGFFCAKGKAKEPIRTLGCVCPQCPIFAKYSLKTGYFCFKGMSKDVPQ